VPKDLTQFLMPNTIEKILFGRVITFTDLQDALCFKHAQNYVQQLPQERPPLL
jgi:hypothetical protein